MKVKLGRGLAAVTAAGLVGLTGPGVAAAAAAPKPAIIVPNIWSCSHWSQKCVQTNGRHVASLPNVCLWTWYALYSNGTPYYRTGC